MEIEHVGSRLKNAIMPFNTLEAGLTSISDVGVQPWRHPGPLFSEVVPDIARRFKWDILVTLIRTFPSQGSPKY
jgi:hypothetical protein